MAVTLAPFRWIVVLAVAAACRGEGPMVSARLVDPRPSAGWNGWPLYLVEVRRSPLAPVGVLDAVWRRFDDVDTVPFVRTLSSVAVIGDTLVLGLAGSATTAFRYDVRTKEISRFPLPEWLHTAEYSPPPALSPLGGHVAYLGRSGDTVRLVVRSWPAGEVVWQSPPVRPRLFGPARGGRIGWRNDEQVQAGFPVSDSGPGWAILQARIRSGASPETEWKILPDLRPEIVVAVPPPPRPVDSAEADRSIVRLSISAYPELPAAFVRELEGCTVPQSYGARTAHNVIHGTFAAPQQLDWAVLCSRDGVSAIRIWWGGPARCGSELGVASDRGFLQSVDDDSVGFARMVRTASTPEVAADSGEQQRMRLAHDGIEDFFLEKGSTIWVCRDGRWVMLPGAD